MPTSKRTLALVLTAALWLTAITTCAVLAIAEVDHRVMVGQIAVPGIFNLFALYALLSKTTEPSKSDSET